MIRSRLILAAIVLGVLVVLGVALSACTLTLPPPVVVLPTPGPTPPVPTPTPKVLEVRQATSGRAVFDVDLSGFSLVPGLDSYAFATLCWQEPVRGVRPTTPCLQLAVRGSDPAPCPGKPCQGRMALEVRYSANLQHDGSGISEDAMCGRGTKPPQWLPLGTGARPRVTVEWGPGFVRASTPAGSWTATQGAATPGFGWWTPGIPPGGIGWSYQPGWTLQAHGGAAVLVDWEAVGAQGGLGVCP